MYQPLKTIFDWLSKIGAKPTDTDHERVHKQFLIYVALLMIGGGLMWGSICIIFGLHLQAAVPLGYIVLTAVNLLYFSRSGHFEVDMTPSSQTVESPSNPGRFTGSFGKEINRTLPHHPHFTRQATGPSGRSECSGWIKW